MCPNSSLFVGIFDGGFHQIFEGAVYRQLFVVLGRTIAFLNLLFLPSYEYTKLKSLQKEQLFIGEVVYSL
jgi:hypothetical protein